MLLRRAPWLLTASVSFGLVAAVSAEVLDFNRDVRPILSDSCFPCHGQDAQQRRAGLRLDTEEGSRADLGGHAALVPGRPEASELVRRIFSDDPEDRMPPVDSHRSLTEVERDRLRRWVAEGAVYAPHWAFVPPVRRAPPEVVQTDWARQPMDLWILARLESEGMGPSADADPGVWLRRASLDLVGLAPTPEETDAFRAAVEGRGESAYAEAVDRLLLSPAFGERQAQEWLDLARYADTHGFNNDTTRTMWRWRDWVIEAFNQGIPYDRFVREQLAGDLLPEPTLDQRMATGFGRNHVVNSEGGIIGEEYRVEYVADRVRTLGMAWLGMTLECARCHDHKFDPISQTDYYRLFAFFNSIDEFGEDGRIGNAAPILVAPTREQQGRLEVVDAEIARLTTLMNGWRDPTVEESTNALHALAAERSPDASSGTVFEVSSAIGTHLETTTNKWLGATLEFDGDEDAKIDVPPAALSGAQPWTLAAWVRWKGGEAPLVSTMDMELDPSAGGFGRGAEVRLTQHGEVEVRLAEFWPSYAVLVRSMERLAPDAWRHVAVTYDGSTKASGLRVYLDGQPADIEFLRDGLTGRTASRHAPRLGRNLAKPPERFHGWLAGLTLATNVVDAHALAGRVETARAGLYLAGETHLADRADGVRSILLRRLDPAFAAAWEARRRLFDERLGLSRTAPQTMVMSERAEPRETFVLKRGRYDAPGEPVEAGVPATLGAPWPDDAPRNRLGLAQWLLQPGHPLTGRVVVNRVWAQLFGQGLVRTVEDFGAQGEPPSHPELLDVLARDFVDRGWDYRGLLRTLVLSRTYRQDSAVSSAGAVRDPENRLIGRGPRVRLAAEVLRDHALSLAGLLETRVGGPSVFPSQPADLYNGVVVAADYPGTKWTQSEGADRYRRSLYTFWKRTVPHPVMTTFDAPDREFCTARRLLTNTPLQALALMNEPTFVEAGLAMGLRAFHGKTCDSRSEADRLEDLFRRATGRIPDASEIAELLRTLGRLRDDFAGDLSAARQLVGREATAEEASWAAVGSLILNLDETVTKN